MILCDDKEAGISDTITVPKALADVFEALAGAVFFDSGRNLKAVWKVFYPIMHPVIGKSSTFTRIFGPTSTRTEGGSWRYSHAGMTIPYLV